MKRPAALKVLNLVIAALLLSQVGTAVLHSMIPHDVYEVVHVGGGYLLAAGVVLHVVLNWSWVRANFLRRREG